LSARRAGRRHRPPGRGGGPRHEGNAPTSRLPSEQDTRVQASSQYGLTDSNRLATILDMTPDTPPTQRDQVRPQTHVPFLRWAGGKRWFVRNHADLIPTGYRTYIEPFLGSGAVFFHLRPERALLSDANGDLITAFQGIRDQPTEVMNHLRAHQESHGVEHYRSVRDAKPPLLAARAARIIYLNRACFNGIYRVNLQGRFNVPMGDRQTIIYDTDDFQALSDALRDTELRAADFDGTIDRAADRGARVLVTNAAHDSVRTLYTDLGFAITEVSRYSPIAATTKGRKQYTEIVISSP
jgi:DNA adenine methylase